MNFSLISKKIIINFLLQIIDSYVIFYDDVCIMNEDMITRTYLETLSFSELVALADDYGVDVPDDLDRRFLIAELLELAEESANSAEEMVVSADDGLNDPVVLSGNYNETQISCILRNPAWLFVFWNISDGDADRMRESEGSNLKIRICILNSPKDPVPKEAFEIQSSTTSQEQYVLIQKGTEFIKAELVLFTDSGSEVLAFSPVITIPQGSSIVNDLQLGRASDFSPIMELSGINEILTEHYKNHRHSFS